MALRWLVWTLDGSKWPSLKLPEISSSKHPFSEANWRTHWLQQIYIQMLGKKVSSLKPVTFHDEIPSTLPLCSHHLGVVVIGFLIPGAMFLRKSSKEGLQEAIISQETRKRLPAAKDEFPASLRQGCIVVVLSSTCSSIRLWHDHHHNPLWNEP